MAVAITPFNFPASYTQTWFQQNQFDDGVDGEDYTGPFALRIRDGQFYVRSAGSTITDGTNGSSVNITPILDVEQALAGTVWVAIQADVDESLVLTNWAVITATTAAGVDEVGLDVTDPAAPFQNKLRLYIGKITSALGSFTIYQACRSAQRVTHGLYNGLAVKVFEPCSIHPDHTS